MSKITPKNLSYDTSLPPFLQRLRGEHAAPSDGRHERSLARPKRARTAQDDEEDEPTYLLDEGAGEGAERTLTREEYAALVKGGEEKDVEAGGGFIIEGKKSDGEKSQGQKSKEKPVLAAIGGARKRKQGRLVGDDGNGDGDDAIGAAVAKAASLAGEKDGQEASGERVGNGKKEKKKKAKKVKLTFGDEEDG